MENIITKKEYFKFTNKQMIKSMQQDVAKIFIEKGELSNQDLTSISLSLIAIDELKTYMDERKKTAFLKSAVTENEIGSNNLLIDRYTRTIKIFEINKELAEDRFNAVSDLAGAQPNSNMITTIHKITLDILNLQNKIQVLHDKNYLLDLNKRFKTINISSSAEIKENKSYNVMSRITNVLDALSRNGLTPLSKSKIEASRQISFTLFGELKDDED